MDGRSEHILGCNAASAYGRRYGFSDIRSVEDYQRRVPLTCHEDYEPYVERLLAGERAQLTCAEPVYYAITSGSTGVPKYVPVTAEDMLVHYNGIYAGVFGMVREYYAQEPPEALFGRIFQVGEFARNRLPGGQMCGVRSASLYQWLDRDGASTPQTTACRRRCSSPTGWRTSPMPSSASPWPSAD